MDLTEKYLTEGKTFSLSFYECEHDGDADNYRDDIRDSGGKITGTKLNYDAETCTIDIQVSNYNTFMNKFKKFESCPHLH